MSELTWNDVSRSSFCSLSTVIGSAWAGGLGVDGRVSIGVKGSEVAEKRNPELMLLLFVVLSMMVLED